MALKVRKDAPPDRVAAFERALSEIPSHMPMVLQARLGRNIIGGESLRFGYTLDTLLEGPHTISAYMQHPYHKEVAVPFSTQGHPAWAVDGWESVYHEPKLAVVQDSQVKDCIKHSLVIQVREGTPLEKTRALERQLAQMPSRIPSIINWGLNRASAMPPSPWTIIWEQEFRDLDGYREYRGLVDDRFNSERPGHIVTKTLEILYPTSSTVIGWVR